MNPVVRTSRGVGPGMLPTCCSPTCRISLLAALSRIYSCAGSLPKLPIRLDIVSWHYPNYNMYKIPQEVDVEDMDSWTTLNSGAHAILTDRERALLRTYSVRTTRHPATSAPSDGLYVSENMRNCKLDRTLLGREESDLNPRLVRY